MQTTGSCSPSVVRPFTALVSWAIFCSLTCANRGTADDVLTPSQERAKLTEEIARLIKARDLGKLPGRFERKLQIESELFGSTSNERFATLAYYSRVLAAVGEFEACTEVRRLTLELRTQVHKASDHWQVVTAKLDWEDAKARSKLSADQRPELIAALGDEFRARDLSAAGKLAEAIKVGDARLRVIERLVGADNRDFAHGLVQLAQYTAAASRHTEATALANRAASCFSKSVGEKHPDYASALNAQGVNSFNDADYGSAIQRLRAAKAIYQSAMPRYAGDYAVTVTNLGEAYRASGNLNSAVSEHKIAAEILSQAGEGARSQYALALCNLGGTLAGLGDYNGAMKAYKNALNAHALCVPESPSERARILSNFASLYTELDDFDSALAHYREAEKTLGTGYPLTTADILNNVGMLHSRRARLLHVPADYDVAVQSHRRALEIRRAQIDNAGLRKDHPIIGRSHFNLGDAYAASGRAKDAEGEYKTALALLGTSLGPDHPHVGELKNSIALVQLRSGAFEAALVNFQEAGRVCKLTSSERHSSHLIVQSNIAYTLIKIGRIDQAFSILREVALRWASVRDDTFDALSKRQRLLFILGKRSHFDLLVSFSIEMKKPAAELYPLVAAYKGALTARQEAERLGRDHPTAKALVAEYLALCSSIVVLNEKVAAGDGVEPARLLREKEAQKEQLEVRIAGLGKYFRNVDESVLRSVEEALPADAALIDYIVYYHTTGDFTAEGHAKGEPHLAAFVLRGGRAPALVPLGACGPLAVLANGWRGSISEGQVPASGEELADRIWRPLGRHLDGVKTVVISPDGPVCGVSFAALPGAPEKANSFLLDEYAFAYVTSAQHWLDRTQRVPPPAGDALVVGRVDFGTPPNGVKERFSKIEPENNSLESFFDGALKSSPHLNVRTLDRSKATAANFRQEFGIGLKRYRFVHLETHGFCDPLNPQRWPLIGNRDISPTFLDPNGRLRTSEHRVGLAFDRANEAPTNVVTAEEIAALDFRGVELVVLAVCRSANGDDVPGEGAFALQRACQISGARTLISSLWDLPVSESREFMAEFYRNLWSLGHDRKLEALRNAQLALRKRAGSKPLEWGGYYLGGDPGATADIKDPAPAEVHTPPRQADPLGGGNDRGLAVVGVGAAGALIVGALLVRVVRRRTRSKAAGGTLPRQRPHYGNAAHEEPR